MVGDNKPVTTVASHKVKPGKEAEFESWVEGVSKVASSFNGHQGIEVVKPEQAGDSYTLIFRFSSAENLATWNNSGDKKKWLKQTSALTVGKPVVQRITGLEYWFPMPAGAKTPPPPYKMAIVTVIGLYPLVQVVPGLVGSVLRLMPAQLVSLVSIAVMVVLMTYLVMPVLVKIFSSWLFSK